MSSFDETVAMVNGIVYTEQQAQACRILESQFDLDFLVDFGVENAEQILRDKVAEFPRALREHSFEAVKLWWFSDGLRLHGPYCNRDLSEYHRENEIDRRTWGDKDAH